MFYIIKKMQLSNTIYVGNNEEGTSEPFNAHELNFLYRYGVQILGMTLNEKHNYIQISPATPPSKASALTLLSKGFSYTTLNGHITVIKAASSYKKTDIVVGDYGEYLDDLSVDHEIFRDGANFIFDDRVKKVGNRWAENNLFGRDTTVLDLTRVTSETLRTSIYKSIKGSRIEVVDTHDDAYGYKLESIILYGNLRSAKDVPQFDDKSHAFFLKRNKRKLLTAISKLTRDQIQSNTAHKLVGVKSDSVKAVIDAIRNDTVMSFEDIHNLGSLSLFLTMRDQAVRVYMMCGGRDKDILNAYRGVLEWVYADFMLAQRVSDLPIDIYHKIPYLDYLNILRVIESHRGDPIPSICRLSALRMYNIKPLKGYV